MAFNANFNNISVISWRSVWLVEETGVPGETHTDKLEHIVLYRVHLARVGFELTTLVVIGANYLSINYHTTSTTTMTAPQIVLEQHINKIQEQIRNVWNSGLKKYGETIIHKNLKHRWLFTFIYTGSFARLRGNFIMANNFRICISKDTSSNLDF
jgi:hypothetical protein